MRSYGFGHKGSLINSRTSKGILVLFPNKYYAWNVFIANVHMLSKFYGMYIALCKKGCDLFTIYLPTDAQLLEMEQIFTCL